jgi:hypothetical protein
MILLEPANTILYGSVEDQAADHLRDLHLRGEGTVVSPKASNQSIMFVPMAKISCRLSGNPTRIVPYKCQTPQLST